MTIASHISDEDVAIQLMRLGDTSNVSRSNRNSASTVGGMTGHDVETSSEAETDDDSGQHDHHQRKKVKVTMPGSASYGAEGPHDTDYSSHNDDANDRSFGDQGGQLHVVKAKSRSKPSSIRVNGTTIKKSGKTSRPPPIKKSKIITLSTTNPTGFISPTSMSAHSRKHSLASTINFANGGLNGTGEDLSAMPRCQRCRKSKKGCDRKRPCGRCKEAGIGPEGCVSEEEGNGRKGRYGRQMGSATKVGPKKAIGPPPAFPQALPAPVAMTALGAPADNYAVSTHANVDFALGPDRKRKREDE